MRQRLLNQASFFLSLSESVKAGYILKSYVNNITITLPILPVKGGQLTQSLAMVHRPLMSRVPSLYPHHLHTFHATRNKLSFFNSFVIQAVHWVHV